MANPVVSPDTYNIYDRGYRTGAQAQLFIGPIWVEEVLQLQISTGTNDIPVYPYASPYFDRLLLGKYIVSGSMGVAYTEPDYLLRIIELARSESITEDELYNMIERRKSIFANSLKYRLLTEKVLQQGSIARDQLANDPLTAHIFNYVDRITREIETTSIRGNGLDPQNFELTIIRGNPYDSGQAIEIYENVKVVGTASVVVNDDSSLMEVYSFTARKKPDRVVRTTLPRPDGFFSLDNLIAMARELAEKLIDRLLEPPAIDVRRTQKRTTLIHNTDKVAITGILVKDSMMYGKAAQWLELVWDVAYSPRYSEDVDDENLSSDTTLILYQQESGGTPEAQTTDVTLLPPQWENHGGNKYFDNSYGRLVSPDRLGTSKYISAVARVTPALLEKRIGGSIILPRYERTNIDVGSFIAPIIITEPTAFSYNDGQLPNLTVSTLWTCTTGFRNTSSVESPDYEDSRQETQGTNYITEVSQPLYSLSYVEKISGIWGDDWYGISIAEPVYVDYKGIAEPEPQTGSSSASSDFVAQNGFKESTYENDYVFLWDQNTNAITDRVISEKTAVDSGEGEKHHAEIDIKVAEGTEDGLIIPIEIDYDENDGIPPSWDDGPAENPAHAHATPPPDYEWKVDDIVSIGPVAWKCNTNHVKEATFVDESGNWNEIGEWFSPRLFTLNSTIQSSALATDLGKCLYIRPLVFKSPGTLENVAWDVGEGAYVGDWTPPTDFPPTGVPPKRVAWFLNQQNGNDRDDTCDFTFDYWWRVKNASAFTTSGANLDIEGYYFIRPKSANYGKVAAKDGPSQGHYIKREDIHQRGSGGEHVPAQKVFVYIMLAILPVKKTDPADSSEQRSVTAKHDMQGLAGRKLELYNITRCDVTRISEMHADLYNPTDRIRESLWNSIRHFLHSAHLTTETIYRWPASTSMNRISGFLRGYACNINVERLVDQILESSFSSEDEIRNLIPAEPAATEGQASGGWTLRKAMANAISNRSAAAQGSALNGITADVYADLSSSIRLTLMQRAQQRGMRVLSDNTFLGRSSSYSGVVTIYRDSLTPAPDVVSWGLTQEGYEELKKIARANVGATGAIELGGYSQDV